MITYNLMNKKSSYLDTKLWESKAIKEVKIFGKIKISLKY